MKTLTAIISTALLSVGIISTSHADNTQVSSGFSIQNQLQQRIDQRMISNHLSLPVLPNNQLVSSIDQHTAAEHYAELQEMGKALSVRLSQEAMEVLLERGEASVRSVLR